MKKLFFILILASCSKEQVEPNVAERSLWPQNPLPPQITISSPIQGTLGGINTPVKVNDTFYVRFSIEAGRQWWGGPSKLTKYKVTFANKVIEEVKISGKTYSGSTLIAIDSVGVYGLNVSAYQDGGYDSNIGFYVSNK